MAKRKNEKRDVYIWGRIHRKEYDASILAETFNITKTRVFQIYREQCVEQDEPPIGLVLPPTNGKERRAIARLNILACERDRVINGDREWFGLDAWTVTALKRFGCDDPGKLHMYSSERLLDVPGLGRTRVNRIREVLAARNKYLSGELPGVSGVDFIICPHCEGKVEHSRWVD